MRTTRRTVLLSGLVAGAATRATSKPKPAPATFALDGHVALRAYQALVEDHLAGYLRALKALALTSDAETGTWAQMQPALEQLARMSSTYPEIWLVQPNGVGVSTDSDGPLQDNMRERDYFAELMAGDDVEGSLVIDKATGRHMIVVATPIVKRGRPIAALGMSVQARMMSEFVARSTQLPADFVFYALDEHGRAAIHTDPSLMFTLPSDFGEPSLTAAVREILSKPNGSVSYTFRGSRRTVLFNQSDSTRWRFALAKLRT